jgi:hypothetical protein
MIAQLHLLFLADSSPFGNPNQVGERLYFHFFHHARAVDLDGFFNRAELMRDLLVQHSGDHQP